MQDRQISASWDYTNNNKELQYSTACLMTNTFNPFPLLLQLASLICQFICSGAGGYLRCPPRDYLSYINLWYMHYKLSLRMNSRSWNVPGRDDDSVTLAPFQSRHMFQASLGQQEKAWEKYGACRYDAEHGPCSTALLLCLSLKEEKQSLVHVRL